MRNLIIILAILVVLVGLLFASGKWIYFMLWTDKTVYEVKEGIKTAGYKHKSKEELKPIVRGYVKELFECHPPILPRWYIKMRSLVKLGKPGIEALIEILKDKEEGKNMVMMAKKPSLEYSMRIATLYVIKNIVKLGKDGSKEYKQAYEAIREQVPTLVDILLHDENVEVRAETAETLGYIGDERAVDGLIKALEDPGEIDVGQVQPDTVREKAAFALGKIKTLKAVAPLIKALEREKRGGPTLGAIGGALADIGDRSAVLPLIQKIEKEYREEGNTEDTDTIAIRIGKLGGEVAVDFLLNELKEGRLGIPKYYVIEALGYAKDPRAVEPLIQIMLNDREFIQVNTAEALANIGDKRAIRPIKEVLKTTKSELFRERMKEALKKLQ